MINLDIVVKYEGGLADDHELDLYDAAESLRGLARSLILPAHYLANAEVIHQAPFAKNVQVRLKASKPGSFESIIALLLDPQTGPLVGVPGIAGAAVVEEVVRHIYNKVVGKDATPNSTLAKSIVENNGPAIDALGDAIENDIVNVHRPVINVNGSNNILIIGNGNRLVDLDKDTYEYARSTIRDQEVTSCVGRISAFNANSQRGRIYDSQLRRTVPFRPSEEFSDYEAQLIAWSLTQYVHDLPGDIELQIKAVRSLNGDIKRYEVVSVDEAPRHRQVAN